MPQARQSRLSLTRRDGCAISSIWLPALVAFLLCLFHTSFSLQIFTSIGLTFYLQAFGIGMSLYRRAQCRRNLWRPGGRCMAKRNGPAVSFTARPFSLQALFTRALGPVSLAVIVLYHIPPILSRQKSCEHAGAKKETAFRRSLFRCLNRSPHPWTAPSPAGCGSGSGTTRRPWNPSAGSR